MVVFNNYNFFLLMVIFLMCSIFATVNSINPEIELTKNLIDLYELKAQLLATNQS